MTLKIGDLYKVSDSIFKQKSESDVTPTTILAYDTNHKYCDIKQYQIMILIDDQFYVGQFVNSLSSWKIFPDIESYQKFYRVYRNKPLPWVKILVNDKIRFVFYNDIELVK